MSNTTNTSNGAGAPPTAEQATPLTTSENADSNPGTEQATPPSTPEGDPANGDGTVIEGVGEISLEQLEAQLQAMEEEQSKLAAQFEANETQQLDSNLAVIEEQFRQSFDDRFAVPAARAPRPGSYVSGLDAGGGVGDLDLMKVNSVFREVSRDLGGEWKPVFMDLMVHFPPDAVSAELEKIEQMQPIIRGYRSLNVWKECSGPDFFIRDLVDVLRKNNMNDVADAALTIIEGTDGATKSTKPVTRRKSDVSSRKTACLDNRRMLLLAKKLGGDWEPLAQALNLPEEELTDIKEGPDSTTYQGAFKVLWAWRQTQPEIEQDSSVQELKAALVQVQKQTLADEFFPA